MLHNTPASATMAAGMAPGESGADSCVTGAPQGAQVVSWDHRGRPGQLIAGLGKAPQVRCKPHLYTSFKCYPAFKCYSDGLRVKAPAAISHRQIALMSAGYPIGDQCLRSRNLSSACLTCFCLRCELVREQLKSKTSRPPPSDVEWSISTRYPRLSVRNHVWNILATNGSDTVYFAGSEQSQSVYRSNKSSRKGQKYSKDWRGQNLWFAPIAVSHQMILSVGSFYAMRSRFQPFIVLRNHYLL